MFLPYENSLYFCFCNIELRPLYSCFYNIFSFFQEAKRRAISSNYQTLGIPIVPSPTSSLPAPPYTSLSSTGSSHTNNTGLNGAITGGSAGSHPRSSDGESDHEYYNDVDRLQREMQPLHQPRNETTV